MDAVHVGVGNVLLRPAAIVHLLLLVPVVAEAIPLAAGLRVEHERVVVDGARRLAPDGPLQRRTTEARARHVVQRQVGGDGGAVGDLARGGGLGLRRQEVEHADLVVVAEEAPGVAVGSVLAERQGVEGRLLHGHYTNMGGGVVL